MEHKSIVNSTEKFRVRGWEIQPYQGKEEMMVDYGSPVLHDELTRILKRMVLESLSEMKPPRQKTENLNNYEMVITSEAAQNRGLRGRGRPATSTLIKELAISFEIPNYCIEKNIDADKVALSNRNSSEAHGKGKLVCGPRFSFQERLEGWYIQCRQRHSNIYDTFYRHTKAKRSFRSIVEVVKFMLFETYPTSRRQNKAILADTQDKRMFLADSSPMINSETLKPTFSVDDKEKKKEISDKLMVKNFLTDSYTNLTNFGSNEEEKVMRGSEYQKGLESEKVEDMLETIYDVLRDISPGNRKMMNNEEEQRNGEKRARTEKGSDNIVSAQYCAASGKERKQEVEEHELDELSAAEVLLNLRSGGNHELKCHIPVTISLHQLAQLVIKIESRRQASRVG